MENLKDAENLESENYKLAMKLIKLKRKNRFDMLRISTDLCRFLMLYRSLKMPMGYLLDPIFTAFCGLLYRR